MLSVTAMKINISFLTCLSPGLRSELSLAKSISTKKLLEVGVVCSDGNRTPGMRFCVYWDGGELFSLHKGKSNRTVAIFNSFEWGSGDSSSDIRYSGFVMLVYPANIERMSLGCYQERAGVAEEMVEVRRRYCSANSYLLANMRLPQ